MANTSFNFNIDPYYDDFEETGGPREQNYMRILFRPGYAVQARELTQLQTIIQNQIKQFGSHVFQDGSPVQGGHLTFDNSVKSIKLQPQYSNNDIDLADFESKLIGNTNTVSTIVRAQVLASDATLVRPTLVFKYLTGNEFTNNQELQVLSSGIKAVSNGTNAIANASIVSINEGVFYVDGYFVYVAPQTIIVDAYNDKPTARIGLQIIDSIIDDSIDASLLDPAQGSFNYQAPGATRYQFTLELAKRTLDSIDDNRFFELIRIENGIVTKQVLYPIYSEIEKTLARRTYDESGHYTVRPFRASVSQHPSDADLFRLNIEPGKAYVNGFEFETVGTVSIDVERARTTDISTDYSFSQDYGNYLIAGNVYTGSSTGFANTLTGDVATQTATILDLHAVPSGRINTSSTGTYSNTKIGTAKFRTIDYSGSDTVSGDNYKVYLYDINLDTPTVNAVSGNISNITLHSSFSQDNDAYKYAKIRINDGPGADSYTRTITSYDGVNRIAEVDYPFAVAPDSNSVITFIYGVQDIDSMVIAPTSFGSNVYYTQNPASNTHLCMDISVDGKTIDGKTTLYGANRNKLLYSLPEQYVDGISSVEYIIKFYQKNKTPSGTIINLDLVGAGASWFYGDGDLSAATAKANFVIIDNALGKIVDLSDSSGNVINQNGATLTANLSYTPTGTFDVISTQKISAVSTGGKTLITPQTTLQTYDTPSGGSSVVGGNNLNTVKVNVSAGHIWFTNRQYIANTPGVKQSIYVTDAVRLVKVFDSGSPSYAPNTTNAIDITHKYILDSGQRDNYYDFASITLRDGFTAPSGQIVVFVEFFNQTLSSGYFSSNAYSSTVYANNGIPRYTTSESTIELRDAIDFRPRRKLSTTSNVQVFSLEGPYVPDPDNFFEATYTYYVPRKDRLVLSKDREFKVLNGSPSVYPALPKFSDDSMLLYNISIPAYTAKLEDIGIEYIENKRYTMRDIGNIDKRVENLEYYTSLNVLELQAKNEAILYEDNVFEKEKYGIIVDDFSSFSVVDNNAADLAINISRNRLAPYRIEKPVKLKVVSTSTATVGEKTTSIAFTETPAIVQSSATKSITVQPYQFAQFYGSVKLLPDSDYWYSNVLKPEIIGGPVESPGSDTVDPVPELDDTVSILPAPAPDVSIPILPIGITALPAIGFGSVDPTTNWFGGVLTDFDTLFKLADK